MTTENCHLQTLKNVLKSLQEYVGVVGLEHQGGPQSDGGLSTAATVNSSTSELAQDLISPRSTVAVDGTECSSDIISIVKKTESRNSFYRPRALRRY